jgi:glycosyltransferase involved in cell wall biosynthesis
MIILNDGSTDNTLKILNDYKYDSRIRIIDQPNKGIFRLDEIYNKCLKLAKGEYIAILEGDDFWVSNKLELQIKIMDDNPNCVLSHGKAINLISETQKIMRISPKTIESKAHCYNNEPKGSFFDCLYDDFFAPLTYMIRKDALIKIGGFKQIHPFPAVDLSTVLELAAIGNFYFINEILGTWRITLSQTTKTLPVEIVEGSQKIIKFYFSKLTSDQRKIIHLTEKEIDLYYKKRMIITYSRNGRFLLIRKKFKEARKSYVKSIFSYGFNEPLWKIRSIIGYILSIFRLDVETLAGIFGRGRIETNM